MKSSDCSNEKYRSFVDITAYMGISLLKVLAGSRLLMVLWEYESALNNRVLPIICEILPPEHV
jgi:hypothetical protein